VVERRFSAASSALLKTLAGDLARYGLNPRRVDGGTGKRGPEGPLYQFAREKSGLEADENPTQAKTRLEWGTR
jgi:hypothetical protein